MATPLVLEASSSIHLNVVGISSKTSADDLKSYFVTSNLQVLHITLLGCGKAEVKVMCTELRGKYNKQAYRKAYIDP